MDTLNIAVYIGVNRRKGRLSMLLVLDMIPLDTEPTVIVRRIARYVHGCEVLNESDFRLHWYRNRAGILMSNGERHGRCYPTWRNSILGQLS